MLIRLFATLFRPPRGRAAVAMLSAGLLLAACGQKGALFVPDMDPDEEVQLEDRI